MSPTGDQNPLKDSTDSKETQKVHKPIKQPKTSPKTLEASLVWSPILLAGKKTLKTTLGLRM
jgi:hypothetical protein